MMRKTVSLIMVLLLVVGLTACKNKAIIPYDVNASICMVESGVIDNNSNYELVWDSENKCVMLKCLKNEKIWSSIPYEYLNEGGSSATVNSTLNISVINTVTMKQDELRGYLECVENGRIASEKTDRGIKVTYYFDNYSIAVPVEYILREDSVAVTVKTKEIVEAGDFDLISLSIAPYLTSADNTDSTAYLMIPSGSGALMSVAENADSTRKYSAAVYGEDASRIQPEILIENEQIYLPVFGAVQSNGNALMGIIESGAAAAEINAEAGNSRTGWSSVYPKFYVRGYDSYPTTQFIWSYQDLDYFSKDIYDMEVTVGYYPLYESDANYVGMAKLYRKYLAEKGQLISCDTNYSPYALSLVGGAQKTVATGGVPHKVTSVVTTFSQAKDIISQISNTAEAVPQVQLIGFGNNGLDIGKIAGGYGFLSGFGSEKERIALEKFCNNKKAGLFTDFDIIRFAEGSNGFSYLSDAAKSASLTVAESYLINVPLRNYDKTTAYRFLKKSQISKAVEKLVKTAEKNGISGISLSSLSSVAYSDFSEGKYGVKGETENIAKESFEAVKKAKIKTAASAANAYAANVAEVLFNTPITNGNYDVFSEWIPFYQMVFAGTKPMYSSYVNLEADSSSAIMRALASGTGVGFAVSANYDNELSSSKTFPLYGTVYEDNKQLIENTVKTYSAYYKAIQGADISSYTNLENGVSLTEYDNGVKIYVNHSKKKATVSEYELEPLSVVWFENGEGGSVNED